MSKDFKRYSSHKLKRLSSSWRRQRGLHNKVRLGFSGYMKKPKVGYGTSSVNKPKILVINNESDFKNIKSADNLKVLFGSKLGKRKKIMLLKKANELGITINNVDKDYITKIENELKERKSTKEEMKKKKEEKQKELDKKAEEKQKADEKNKEKEKTSSKETEQTSAETGQASSGNQASSDKQESEKPNIKSESSEDKSEKSEKELKDQEKKEKDKILTKKGSL